MTQVLTPLEVLEDAQEALGNFVSDHGWGDADMRAFDNLAAVLAEHKACAAAPQPAPMSESNRLVSYLASEKLHSLGFTWDEKEKTWAAPQPAQADMAPEYAAAVRELAEQSGISGAQVLRAAIRLYQAEQKGLVTVEHKEQIGPLAAPQPEAQPRWQPIETAPKDGVLQLLWWGGSVTFAKWLDNSKCKYPWAGWQTPSLTPRPPGEPTHWMPLPAAPSAQAEPKQDDWIEWRGGKCPVPHGTSVCVRHRSGREYTCPAGTKFAESWAHNGWISDIVAYRAVGSAQAEQGGK